MKGEGMNRAIELLKQAEKKAACVVLCPDGKYPGRDRKYLDEAMGLIREAAAILGEHDDKEENQ